MLSVVLLFAQGCGSDKLTRSKAKKIINNSLRYPRFYTARLNVGERVKYPFFPLNDKPLVEQIKMLNDFAKEGLIDFKSLGKRTAYIKMTKKGSKHVLNSETLHNRFEYVNIALVGVKVNKITGIRLMRDMSLAKVTYVAKDYLGETPFKKYYMAGKREYFNYYKLLVQTIIMELYDDGWRIQDRISLLRMFGNAGFLEKKK